MISPDDELRRENEKLRKIARVLTDRVERDTDARGNAFSLFQAAITLEGTIRKRTAELLAVNERLRREIEERMQAEDLLRLATAAAEQANVGKTKFLAAASHDLFQPLNAARLLIATLRDKERDPECALIVKHAEDALATANDVLVTLLDISKLDAGAVTPELEAFSVAPLLERLGHDYALQAEMRGLRLRVFPSPAMVFTDPRMLERILRNLISNAIKYTSRGGVIVGCRRREQSVSIEVWDSGSGIPQDQLGDAFLEFRRLNATINDGVGLGLSIVQRIAKLLQHPITVRSRVGRGSVFSIEVPLTLAAPNEGDGSVDGATAYPDLLKGKTIVVVDDQDAQLQSVAELLRSWGCATITAHSIDELAAELSTRPRPHFMIVDFHLGTDVTGIDAIRMARALYPEAPPPVAVLTADHSREVRDAVIEAAAYILYRPVQIARLRALLNHAFTSPPSSQAADEGPSTRRFTTFA